MSSPRDDHETEGEDGKQQAEEENCYGPQAEVNEPAADEDEKEIPYPEPEASSLLPPPDFRPFFTLIEDPTGDHHHPTVHYIFADDDPEILTEAALSTLSTTLPDERFIILDLSASGKEILSASSLSPDWQALTTRTSAAPSWGGKGGADGGLMLTIAGQEARVGKRKKVGSSVEGLLKEFDAGLDALDCVLGADVTTVDTQVTQH